MMQTVCDQNERSRAIDPSGSFIVQAPAGSGKTELLIQRYLALLARVETPQQILAITFTRKAAAEMRNRLVDALSAAQSACPDEDHKAQTWTLATQALKQDKTRGWNLLQNPALLAIQTIDSFNSSLVRKMPWLSRFGGLPELADDPTRLYLQATERLLQRLGTDRSVSESLRLLLTHLDNNMSRLQQMLIEMLKRRDQWLRHLYTINQDDPCLALESALTEVVEAELKHLVQLLPNSLTAEFLACGRVAAANLAHGKDRPLLCLTDLDWMPGADVAHLPLWKGLADLLLSSSGTLRKPRGISASCGFPANDSLPRKRMQQLVEQLEAYPSFLNGLELCRQLPEARYPQEQRQILGCLIQLLPQLVGELWLVFRAEGQADYSEISLMARAALGSVDDPSDLLLKLDNRIDHILVDEFQDTSWMQYGLLEMLTSGWQDGDGRSLFLVGDPMQSIYRFREAEVGLFLTSFAGRLGDNGPRLKPLRLQANFRSQQGIVDWVNRTFAEIFPAEVEVTSGAVPLAPATAVHASLAEPALSLTAFNGRDDSGEAEQVAALVEKIRSEKPQDTIAILVRGRNHLPHILSQLRKRNLPYQAQDIEFLGRQPVALDLLTLTRALLHRADQLAWLSLLRAPWCGLTLEDMYLLTEVSQGRTIPGVLENPDSLQNLSSEGRQRIARIWPILKKGLRRRGRYPLRILVESCWLALGGGACYGQGGRDDAALVFDLLENLQTGGELPSHDMLEEGLARLFAVPDVEADAQLQVMTIHKAKGLEFDHVILPGLGRSPRQADSPLLRWVEDPQAGLLMAPIAAKDGSDQDPIYQFIARLERKKQDLEVSRLLYVAATRAKKQLYLFGHAKETQKGDLKPEAGSLLAKLWPVLKDDFCHQPLVAQETEEEFKPLLLRRLPADWTLPFSQKPLVSAQVQTRQPSTLQGDEQQDSFRGQESQARRHVGTLVHKIFEQITRRGTEYWQEQKPQVQEQWLRRQLAGLGVANQDLKQAIVRVRAAVEKALASEKGQWILHPHQQGASELELSGQLDGQLIHAVIDRTFVDPDGIRWIIDYKTGTPQATESVDRFVQREIALYRVQLASYFRLMRAMEPTREIRSALYFPLLNHFVEVAHESG